MTWVILQLKKFEGVTCMTIYTTQDRPGYSKNERFWNDYRLEGDTVTKYRCRSDKFFDGKENVQEYDEQEIESWNTEDPNMPEWIKQYI